MEIHRYQILTLILVAIAVVLLTLYCFFADSCPIFSNIILGISTGLISGIVLLTVTGRKSIDRGKLEKQLKSVQAINDNLREIHRLADDLIHRTYKGKAENMFIGEYALALEHFIFGFGYNDPSLKNNLRKIQDEFEKYKNNSEWFRAKERRYLRKKVEELSAGIHGVMDSYNSVNSFMEEFDICAPNPPSDPVLEQVARADLDNITFTCRSYFHPFRCGEIRLEEKIRAEIARMDRSLI